MSTPSRRAASTSGAAVMPQSTVRSSLHALRGEPLDRRLGDAVALLEATGQMPRHVGAELAQCQHRERRCADAVHVVIAVNADLLAPFDRGPKPLDRRRHVTEQERVVRDLLRLEEGAGVVRIAEAAAHEHGRDRLRDPELGAERAHIARTRRTPASSSGPCGHLRSRPDGHGRRPLSDRTTRPARLSRMTLTQKSTSPIVAPTTTTATGVR